MRLSVILILLSIISGVSASEPRLLWPTQETTPYAEGDTEDDLPRLFHYPAEKPCGTSVVVCPGGGYGGLAVDHEGNQIAQYFNSLGIDAWVLHYRLGSKGYHFPTQLADVQRALRIARSEAQSPERIGICGFSAGGHLASMGATKFNETAYDHADEIDKLSARPDFAVLCYPVISMEDDVTHMGSRRNLMGPERADDTEFAIHLSSDKNVTAETPPTFLFQTDEDAAVPAENALRFVLALREHEVPCELHLYQRGVHGVGLYQGDPILSTWSGHLSDWLRSNGFLMSGKPKGRLGISGTATLDGTPISWGSVTFHPEDGSMPRTTIRIRKGRFKADAENGPLPGKSRVTFAASIWEETQDPSDRVHIIDRGIVDLDSDEPLSFELTSP